MTFVSRAEVKIVKAIPRCRALRKRPITPGRKPEKLSLPKVLDHGTFTRDRIPDIDVED